MILPTAHQSFRLYVSNDYYLFEPVYLDPSVPTENLTIYRDTGKIQPNVPAVTIARDEVASNVYGIMGMINLYSGYHLIVITDREKIASVPASPGAATTHEIYRVKSTKIYPLARSKLHLSETQVFS